MPDLQLIASGASHAEVAAIIAAIEAGRQAPRAESVAGQPETAAPGQPSSRWLQVALAEGVRRREPCA